MSRDARARLGIVWVHYKTPELVRPSVAAVGADLAATGLRSRLLLVDNGSTREQRRDWADLPIERIEPGDNVGYAGALTLAVARLDTPFVVVLNPDVFVRPGCLERLVAALEAGAAAAGPRFVWDERGRFLLPPTEERTRTAELLAALAPRAPRLARLARQRWRRHARRHWTATRPIPSRALSGALLAFRRDAWDRIGPFDSAYRLYFEESDWLRRLGRAGLGSVYEPRAEALHLYAQSSLHEPASSLWFAQSAARFRRLAYGALVARALARIERREPSRAFAARPLPDPTLAASELPDEPHWIEVSPSATGLPAAAERRGDAGTDWTFPADAWRRLPAGPCWVRVVGAREERAPWRLEKSAS